MRTLIAIIGVLWLQDPVRKLSPERAREAVEEIVVYRGLVLEDHTAINFCAIPDFWDAGGRFLGGRDELEFTTVRTREDCSTGPQRGVRRSVTIDSLLVSGDTVFVHSTTRRGETSFWERYMMTGLRTGKLRGRQYVVTHIIQS